MRTACFVICVVFASVLAQAQNPVPFVNQPLVPDATAPGGPSFTLTVNGTGFVPGATVNWNGVGLSTTFVNQGQLAATVPATDITTAETASITVANPAPGGGTSAAQFFSVTNQAAVVFTELDSGTGLIPGEGNGIVAGDFNGNGKLDLATPQGEAPSPGMCVLLGVGDGTFQAPKCSSALGASDQGFMLAADFNADGKLDIATASNASGHALVLLGKGDGTFQDAAQLSVPIIAFNGLAVGDFNHDGKLDLIVAQFDDLLPQESYSVFLGNGDGTFSAPVVTTTSNPDVGGPIVAGDFDRDGKLDLAGPDFILLGNGDGKFQTPQTFGNLSGYSILAADVDGDAKLDLIVAGQPPGDISILLGNGDGTFQSPINLPPEILEEVLAAGDLNADDRLDLATANSNAVFFYLLGNGDGTFQSSIGQSMNTGVSEAIQLGDFNGDGRMDVAVRSGTQPYDLGILLQGQFPAANVLPNSLTFSTQATGSTSPAQKVTVKNAGTSTMVVSGISLGGADAGDFAQINTCGSSLAVSVSCQISVTFTPTAGGERTASLSVADSAPGSPQTVALSGNAIVPDFSVTANSPTTQTVTSGQAANYTVTISPINGFNHSVSMSCSGAPAQSTCIVTPDSATLNGTDATAVHVAVVTTGTAMGLTQAASGPPKGGSLAVWAGLAAMMWTGLMVASVRRSRRPSYRYALAFLVLWSIGLTLPSCGGGSGGNVGTPFGTYTLTVTGTFTAGSNSLEHSTQLTLVVDK